MRRGGSAFPVNSSDFVESIPLKFELVICFHAKLLRFGYKALKIREGDNSGVEHDGGARESHGLIQAHNRRGSEVDVELVVIQAWKIHGCFIVRSYCTSGLQKAFKRLNSKWVAVIINSKFHAPMIAQAVI